MAGWRPWQYVLTGAGVIVAISTVTIVVSILLHPAHISFFVFGFSEDNGYNDDPRKEGTAVAYAFNLTFKNPSRRTEVLYPQVLVSMKMGRNGKQQVRETSVPARVLEEPPLHQGRLTCMTVRVRAVLDNDFLKFYNFDGNAYATISVFAQAQFKVWFNSRVYNLRLSCTRINFTSLGTQSGTATCYDYVVD